MSMSPLKRVYADGTVKWIARYTGRDSKLHYAKPCATFDLKREAQQAIDAEYAKLERRVTPTTVRGYFANWTIKHPRSERTDSTNAHRVGRLLEVEIEGIALGDWEFHDLHRRHVLELVHHMLVAEGRARQGAVNILRSYSAMAEDAITDEITDVNAFRGVRVRANDPRIRKDSRPVRVFDFDQMHAFAAAMGPYEGLGRLYSDCGLRLGEGLPVYRTDLSDGLLEIRRTAHEGRIFEGTKTDHGELAAGRVVPVPPSTEELLRAGVSRIDTPLLHVTPRGKLWRERNFYRDVWEPARETTGLDIRPHEMRHSYVSHMAAAGIDEADLASYAGHSVETMNARYRHALGRSAEKVRGVIG